MPEGPAETEGEAPAGVQTTGRGEPRIRADRGALPSGMWQCTKDCFAMHKIDIMFVHGLQARKGIPNA
jgi:hypothetical protein